MKLQVIKNLIKKNKFIYTQAKRIYIIGKYIKASIKNNNYENNDNINLPIVRINSNEDHCFFGYYDKSPLSEDGNRIIYLKTDFSSRMPRKTDIAKVCIKYLNTNEEKILGVTTAWNWQQGSMLQWLGNKNKEIIFNSSINDRYVSIIINTHTLEKRVINKPVYTVSKDGNYALTLNFNTLHKASPGYGYISCIEKKDSFNENGIWLIDLLNGQVKKILSIKDIIKFKKKAVFDKAFNYINHIEFNPSGERFVFFHRWQINEQEFTRMITADKNGDNMFLLADDEMVSHYSWKDDVHLLAWANNKEYGKNYYLYKDRSKEIDIVGRDILIEDGHPSLSNDKKWILTDTYPNNKRIRSLILYNITSNEKHIIGEFFSPIKFEGSIRCDLHPRWSRDNSKVCIDSVHEGKRSIYLLDVLTIVGEINNG